MKPLYYAIPAAFVLIAACGPRTEPESPSPGAPSIAVRQPPEADARPVIVAFGDSISEGYGVQAGSSYPDFLQNELDRKGLRYRVVNAGVSGDTTAGGLARLPRIVAMKPEIVILELGGNDGLRGFPLSVTKANLEKMIVALKDAGARVLLVGMTLPANYGSEYIKPFEQMYRDLAAAHNVELAPFIMDGAPHREGRRDLVQADGIHPTAEGHRYLAEGLLRHLEPMLETR